MTKKLEESSGCFLCNTLDISSENLVCSTCYDQQIKAERAEAVQKYRDKKIKEIEEEIKKLDDLFEVDEILKIGFQKSIEILKGVKNG